MIAIVDYVIIIQFFGFFKRPPLPPVHSSTVYSDLCFKEDNRPIKQLQKY